MADYSYWSRCNTDQFYSLGVETYIKVADLLDENYNLHHTSGKYIDNQIQINSYLKAMDNLEKYLRTEYPYFVYEGWNDYINKSLEKVGVN